MLLEREGGRGGVTLLEELHSMCIANGACGVTLQGDVPAKWNTGIEKQRNWNTGAEHWNIRREHLQENINFIRTNWNRGAENIPTKWNMRSSSSSSSCADNFDLAMRVLPPEALVPHRLPHARIMALLHSITRQKKQSPVYTGFLHKLYRGPGHSLLRSSTTRIHTHTLTHTHTLLFLLL